MDDTDPELFLRINAFARSTGWLHPLMAVWANYGVITLAVLLVPAWWLGRHRNDPTSMAAALWAAPAVALALAVNQPIADMVAEPRPYAVLPNIVVLAHHSSDPSCPNYHAVIAGAAAAALFTVDRRLGEVGAGVAALLAFARVYTAANYPADVLLGLGFGIAVAVAGWLVVRDALTEAVVRLTATRWRRLVATSPPVPLT